METQILVRTPRDLHRDFKSVALTQGKTMSDLLRDYMESVVKASK